MTGTSWKRLEIPEKTVKAKHLMNAKGKLSAKLTSDAILCRLEFLCFQSFSRFPL
jgi:hypothetical protein